MYTHACQPGVCDLSRPGPESTFFHGPGPGPANYSSVPGLGRDFKAAVLGFKENKKNINKNFSLFDITNVLKTAFFLSLLSICQTFTKIKHSISL